MTKDQMIERFLLSRFELVGEDKNYVEAQKRIKAAMEMGGYRVNLPGKSAESKKEFSWTATLETIEHLKKDGFQVDVVNNEPDYWSIEWY